MFLQLGPDFLQLGIGLLCISQADPALGGFPVVHIGQWQRLSVVHGPIISVSNAMPTP
jgi:hypothetical protein